MVGKMWRAVLVEPALFVTEEVDIPSPKPGEALIKVGRVGVCGSDISALHDKHPYIHRPIVLGHEVSGVVVEADAESRLGPGTRVAVIPHLVCGSCGPCSKEVYNLCENLKCIGAQADGAHSEYIVMDEKMVLPIPDDLSLDDAAMVEPAAVAYHGIKRTGIGSNDSIFIVGAGPIGIFAMQSAKALGAKAVYIADIDSWRLSLASKLGADGVIDLSVESMSDGLTRLAGSPKQISVMADCVGGKGDVLNQLIELAPRGSRIVMIGVLGNNYDIPALPNFVEHELALFGTTMYVPQDYREVIDHMSAGRISTEGMVTHTFDLKDLPAAFDMIDDRREPFFKVMFRVSGVEADR